MSHTRYLCGFKVALKTRASLFPTCKICFAIELITLSRWKISTDENIGLVKTLFHILSRYWATSVGIPTLGDDISGVSFVYTTIPGAIQIVTKSSMALQWYKSLKPIEQFLRRTYSFVIRAVIFGDIISPISRI